MVDGGRGQEVPKPRDVRKGMTILGAGLLVSRRLEGGSFV